MICGTSLYDDPYRVVVMSGPLPGVALEDSLDPRLLTIRPSAWKQTHHERLIDSDLPCCKGWESWKGWQKSAREDVDGVSAPIAGAPAIGGTYS